MFQTARARWRAGFLALALFCGGSVVFALILQFQDLAPPCPLCIFQRLGVMACGLIGFIAVFCPPRAPHTWLWPSLTCLAALAGAGVSLRHIQIQSAAAAGGGSDTCGPGLNYMLQMDSVPNVIASVLTGHGDCTQIDWQIFGITLPMLALAGFVMMALWAWGVRSWSARAA